ncbi:MAG TPA: hypothetical protein V6C65_13660, partial [Allocoleopsis sp.]
ISRWSIGAYGTLVDVNAMVPEVPANSPIEPIFKASLTYEPTWHNLGLNWLMLCIHTLVYLTIALWLQRRKDII